MANAAQHSVGFHLLAEIARYRLIWPDRMFPGFPRGSKRVLDSVNVKSYTGGENAMLKHRHSGFTLLEMMLTVGLIALTATFVGLNIGSSDTKLANLEAKRIVALINLAVDESIVTGRPLLLTIDAPTHSYNFAPLEVPAVFAVTNTEDEDQASYKGRGRTDDFFKQRVIPEVVMIEFSRLPDLPDPNAGVGFVPKRVHEIMQKSLFEREDKDSEEDSLDAILIEPNGLISPFTLKLSVGQRVSSVGLDRFGKAALLGEQ